MAKVRKNTGHVMHMGLSLGRDREIAKPGEDEPLDIRHYSKEIIKNPKASRFEGSECLLYARFTIHAPTYLLKADLRPSRKQVVRRSRFRLQLRKTWLRHQRDPYQRLVEARSPDGAKGVVSGDRCRGRRNEGCYRK